MIRFCNIWLLLSYLGYCSIYFGLVRSPFSYFATSGSFSLVSLYFFLVLVFFNLGFFSGFRGFELKSFKGYRLSDAAQDGTLFVLSFLFAVSTLIIYFSQSPFGVSEILLGRVENIYVMRQQFSLYSDSIPGSASWSYSVSVLTKAILFFPLLLMLIRCSIEKKSNWLFYVSVAMVLGSTVLGGVMKGTTKEFFDAIYYAGFLYYCRRAKKIDVKIIAGAFVIILLIFYFNLSLRVSELNDVYSVSYVVDVFLQSVLGYLAQGYVGLSNVMFVEVERGLPVNHLEVLRNLLVSAGLIDASTTLVDRLDMIGWKKGQQWSTMYSVLATDFGWIGALFYIFLVGFSLGVATGSNRRGLRVYPVMVVFLCLYIILFSSMNFQVGLNFHWFIVYFFIFLSLPLFVRAKRV